LHQWTRRTPPQSPRLTSSSSSSTGRRASRSPNPPGNPCADWPSLATPVPDIDWFAAAAAAPESFDLNLFGVAPAVDAGLDSFGLVDSLELYNGLDLSLFDLSAPDQQQLFVEMETPIDPILYPQDPLFDYSTMPPLLNHYRDSTSSSPDTFLASLSSTPQLPSLMSLATSPSSSLGVSAPSEPTQAAPPAPAVDVPRTSSKRKASDDDDDSHEDGAKADKRQRNTMAARKYRQKRLDLIADLEKALGDMTAERDELRLQLARKDAEAGALREMLAKK
jgi:hypothetical protein